MRDGSDSNVLVGHGGVFAYALKGDRCVHVSEVSRGLACGCHCVGCGQPLLARKGPVRAQHFSHWTHTSCSGAPETALHLAAKQVLSELNQIDLPEYRYRPFFERASWRKLPDGGLVAPERTVPIDRCETEVPVGLIIPDALLWRGQRCLAVEIVVTNRVRRGKVRAYRQMDQSAIEIRLDRECQSLTPTDLRQIIGEDLACKRWIYHPKQRPHQKVFLERTREARAARRRRMFEPEATLGRPPPKRLSQRSRLSPNDAWRAYDDWAERIIAKTGKPPTLEMYRAFKERQRR